MLRATAVGTLEYGFPKLAEQMLICCGFGVHTSYLALQHQACTRATGQKGGRSHHRTWKPTCSLVETQNLPIASDVASGTRLAPVVTRTGHGVSAAVAVPERSWGNGVTAATLQAQVSRNNTGGSPYDCPAIQHHVLFASAAKAHKPPLETTLHGLKTPFPGQSLEVM